MHTDLDNIERLLHKYLEAETSLQEEALLKDYFTGDKVANHLKDYVSMFQMFKESKEERFTQSIRLKHNNMRRRWMGLAASVILLLAVFGYRTHQQNKKAEKAYADTQKTLQIIATQMNKGTIAIGQLDNFSKTENKIFKKTIK